MIQDVCRIAGVLLFFQGLGLLLHGFAFQGFRAGAVIGLGLGFRVLEFRVLLDFLDECRGLQFPKTLNPES